MNKKYVFGLGTGRCGTVSLSNLLNFQQHSNVTHEFGAPFIPWKVDNQKINMLIENIKNRDCILSGDVSFYLLPYANVILEALTNAKFIIIQRDKKETIDSYIKKTKGYNQFSSHDGSIWQFTPWDQCYPNMEGKTKEESVSKYYDLYYRECRKIEQDVCFWINTKDLNNKNKMFELLDWLGVSDKKYDIFNMNRGS
jgi:hypothetical protein